MLTFDLMIVTFTLIIHHRCVSVLIFFFFLNLQKWASIDVKWIDCGLFVSMICVVSLRSVTHSEHLSVEY